jgi:hypothetical protein
MKMDKGELEFWGKANSIPWPRLARWAFGVQMIMKTICTARNNPTHAPRF